MGDTSREIGRGRGWRLPPLRRSGGGENRRGCRSQGLQCNMSDKTREIGRGRGWCLPPLRRSEAVKTAKVAGARGCSAAEYCKGAEECVEGSTAPVRRRGLSYRGEARGSVL